MSTTQNSNSKRRMNTISSLMYEIVMGFCPRSLDVIENKLEDALVRWRTGNTPRNEGHPDIDLYNSHVNNLNHALRKLREMREEANK